jgi:thiamine pyrophosphokinase
VLPLSNEGIVSLEGVLWPLKHAVMKASEPYAVSNELTAEKMSFTCEKGLMGLYIAG